MKKVIQFSVKVTYETEDDSPICETDMRENLQRAIENERLNGALTSDEISASEVDIDVTYITESNTLDMGEAITLFLTNLLEHDGVTIEDFINSETSLDCSYTEDSLWLIDGKMMDESDIKALLTRSMQDIEGETLMSHFAGWADSVDIHYEGDGQFYHMPDEDAA